MAAAIPLVIGFVEAGSIAAGMASLGAGLAGAAGITGFLSAAGSILGAVGAITGSKDLSKVGMLMSLGGSLGSAFGNAAASAGSEATASAWADGAAGKGLDTIDAVGGSASNLATAQSETSQWLSNAGSGQMASGLDAFGPSDSSILSKANSSFDFGPTGLEDAANSSLIDKYRTSAFDASGGLDGATQSMDGAPQSPTAKPDIVAEKGSGLTMQDIVKSAGGKLEKLPQWIKENKELATLAGQMAVGMFGPQAEQLDWQKSIMAKRNSNLNSPVKMGLRTQPLYGTGG